MIAVVDMVGAGISSFYISGVQISKTGVNVLQSHFGVASNDLVSLIVLTEGQIITVPIFSGEATLIRQ